MSIAATARTTKSILISKDSSEDVFKGFLSLNSLYVDLIHSAIVKMIQNYFVLKNQKNAVVRIGTDGLNNYLVISRLYDLQTVPMNCSFRVDKNGVSEIQFKISVVSRNKTKLNLRDNNVFDATHLAQLRELSDIMKRSIYVGNFADVQTFAIVGVQSLCDFVRNLERGDKLKISVRDFHKKRVINHHTADDAVNVSEDVDVDVEEESD